MKAVFDRFADVVGKDWLAAEVAGPDPKAFWRALVVGEHVRTFVNGQAGVVKRKFRWALSE